MDYKDFVKMGYKRFYLWGSVSIIGIFALIAPLIESYYGYEESVTCGEHCWVEFNYTLNVTQAGAY